MHIFKKLKQNKTENTWRNRLFPTWSACDLYATLRLHYTQCTLSGSHELHHCKILPQHPSKYFPCHLLVFFSLNSYHQFDYVILPPTSEDKMPSLQWWQPIQQTFKKVMCKAVKMTAHIIPTPVKVFYLSPSFFFLFKTLTINLSGTSNKQATKNPPPSPLKKNLT